MKDFIPVGIGIQTSGADPDKHQLLNLSLVSFLSGARISSTLRHSDITVDIQHCKDFLTELGEGKGSDADLVDRQIDKFLDEQSKVLLDDIPATRVMKMVPTGIDVNKSMRFIQKTLPNTFRHLMGGNAIELTSLFVLEGLRDNIELIQIQAQYKTRAEMRIPNGFSDSTLTAAYISCYILADFQQESPNWMHGLVKVLEITSASS